MFFDISEEDNANLSLTAAELKEFNEKGYIGPFSLFKEDEIRIVMKECADFPNALLPWRKARHAAVRAMAAIGMQPIILKKVVSILGNNVLLWGSQIIQQQPHKKHNIHIDIEHTVWEGVTVWLALKNVVGGASFSVIPGSHTFPLTTNELQEIDSFKGKDEDAILGVAKKFNSLSKLEYLDVKNGQFIIFSGKLWHGTKNITPDPRFSMIFQYTRPESIVKIPKNYRVSKMSWYQQKPPCLMVHGQDHFKSNLVIDFNNINKGKSYLKGLFYYLPLNGFRKLTNRLRGNK